MLVRVFSCLIFPHSHTTIMLLGGNIGLVLPLGIVVRRDLSSHIIKRQKDILTLSPLVFMPSLYSSFHNSKMVGMGPIPIILGDTLSCWHMFSQPVGCRMRVCFSYLAACWLGQRCILYTTSVPAQTQNLNFKPQGMCYETTAGLTVVFLCIYLKA